MKRISMYLIVLLVAAIFAGCATFREIWIGPEGSATPACNPQPGLGFAVGDKEFVHIGTYKGEDVFVLRQRGGAK